LFTLNIEQADMKKATQIPTDGFDHFLYQLLSAGAMIDFDDDNVSSSFNDGL